MREGARARARERARETKRERKKEIIALLFVVKACNYFIKVITVHTDIGMIYLNAS